MKVSPWTDKVLMKGAEPIFLPGKKKTGVLLFHGWSSSPQEFNPDYTSSTVKHLNDLGYAVYVPLRIGHGTKPDDFKTLRLEDWLKDARDHFRAFIKEQERVVVGGMSMGANLALQIASEENVAGVIPMGTPIYMRMHALFAPWAWLNQKNLRMRHKRYLPQDKEIAMKKVHYLAYPNSHLFEVLRAAKATKKILGRVTAPALIMHSANDNVIHPSSAKYVYDHIASSDKEIVYIPDSYHSFTTDRHADIANKAIGEFLDKIEE